MSEDLLQQANDFADDVTTPFRRSGLRDLSESLSSALVILVPILVALQGCGGVDPSDRTGSDTPASEDGNDFELDDDGVVGMGGKADGFEASYSLAANLRSYEQDDSAWENELLYLGVDCAKTIGRAGCAVTSQSMVASYYGGTRTPKDQSECLGEQGAHNGCSMAWSGCLPPGVTYQGNGSGSLESIRNDLEAGHPVVAFVRKASRQSCHHFVVVTGYSGAGTAMGDFEIVDPASGNKLPLSAYGAVCSTRRFTGPVP